MQKTNFRKGGAGAGNVGTYKDELRRGEEAEATEVPEQRAEDGTAAEPTEPAKDVKTLEEYFREKGVTYQANRDEEDEEEENERQKKKEIDKELLKKEKLELIVTKEDLRQREEAENKQVGKKKKNAHLHYKAAFESEHTELLGLRTGQIFVEERKRVDKPVRTEKPAHQATGEAAATESQAKAETAPATTDGATAPAEESQ